MLCVVGQIGQIAFLTIPRGIDGEDLRSVERPFSDGITVNPWGSSIGLHPLQFNIRIFHGIPKIRSNGFTWAFFSDPMAEAESPR